jgi:hypothetical protein
MLILLQVQANDSNFSTITMTRLTKGMMWLGMFLASVGNLSAFALLGPFKTDASVTGRNWQAPAYGGRPQGLGYTTAGTSIGGPMFAFEAYRWNVPTITYAFDSTFLRYFGPKGVAAVEEAIAILNALPPASQMDATLTEFPLDTKGINGGAAELGLQDLKSYALTILMEEMGLASPERYVWNLRTREVRTNPNFTNYTVIQLNYDPVTIQSSRYVNGVLYNYQIDDAIGLPGNEWASAVEWYQLDPLYRPYSSVAGAVSLDRRYGEAPGTFFDTGLGLSVGEYFRGLTRDDVGGLRFLLSTNHIVTDTLLTTVLPRTSGGFNSPWAPIISSNFFGTNLAGLSNLVGTVATNLTNFVRTAERPGVDKITFQRVPLLGNSFTPITLRYTDRYLSTNTGRMVRQPVERLVLAPDIIFAVGDLGTVQELPVVYTRTDTTAWTNNAALNTFVGGAGLGGPGTINPPVVIRFSDMVPYWFNTEPGQGEIPFSQFGLWGSFDGTDTPPVVYPIFQHPLAPDLSLEYLQDLILGRTGN